MNFDDIKSSYQSLSFEGGDSASIDFTRKVEGAVEKVQKEDRRDKILLISVSVMLGGIGLIYGLIGILEYLDNPQGNGSWGYAIYVLGIITVLPYFVYKIRQIKKTCYDVPVAQFIANVEKRYALFQIDQLFILPFLVLADVAMVYMMAEGNAPTIKVIIVAQIPLIMGFTIGLAIGLVLWYSRKLPILEELRRIKKSIE
jgi:hypothetical protein